MKATNLKTIGLLFGLMLAPVASYAHEGYELDYYKSLPENYQALSGCEKQDIIWDKIEATEHHKLPKFSKFGLKQLVGMGIQSMTTKVKKDSDISPKKWKKYLHRRGSVAQVEFIPSQETPYTGVFQGAECALLRLSITYRPTKKRDFAPGLALKFFRNGAPSANISALYRLEGQGKDYNFFKNPLSNIVPTGDNLGLKLVNKIFKRVTDYPEELVLRHLGDIDSEGQKVEAKTPRQIFFVPVITDKFDSKKHDVREDFHKVPAGTKLYKVYAANPKLIKFDYSEYKASDIQKFVKDAEHIGDIVTKTRFISSAFGDEGIFFRHEVRKKK